MLDVASLFDGETEDLSKKDSIRKSQKRAIGEAKGPNIPWGTPRLGRDPLLWRVKQDGPKLLWIPDDEPEMIKRVLISTHLNDA